MEKFSKNPEICEQFLKPRSSLSLMFFKIDFVQDFALFTGKHLRWSLFLTKLQTFMSATLLKRDSNTSVFLWILRNFFKTSLFIEHFR